MPLPNPEPGLAISYAYLWHAEHMERREEAVKSRPCVILVAVRHGGGKQVVTVVPITHSLPGKDDAAVEIPLHTKQRLGLDEARSWVMVSEVNAFVWPGPDLRALPRNASQFDYGFLAPRLFRQIRDRIAAHGHAGQLRSVPRTE